MCMAARCSTCNNATWYGCGLHIQRVMDQLETQIKAQPADTPEGSKLKICDCDEKYVDQDGKEWPAKGMYRSRRSSGDVDDNIGVP